ncbi:MAG: hypothetical protein PVI59_10620 [Anaerolineae bacterium]
MKCSHCGGDLGSTYYSVPRGAKLRVMVRGRAHDYVNREDMELCRACCNEMADHFGFQREALRERFQVAGS